MPERRAIPEAAHDLAEAIVAAVHEPLVVLDGELSVMFVSPSFERLFRIAGDSVWGRSLSEVAPPLVAGPELRALVRRTLEGASDGAEQEVEVEIPTLGLRWLRLSASRIRIEGAQAAVLVAIVDITAQRDASRATELQRDTLRVLLDNRMGELAQTTAALSREVQEHQRTAEQLRHANRLATVGRLTAGLVHELGTPLNVVAARARLIVQGRGEDEELRRHAGIIEQQAARMTRLIRRLLTFSRQQRADEVIEDARALVEATARLLEPLAKKRGASLEVVAGAGVGGIDADGAEVEQILANLVVNAIDAQADSGGVIRLDVSAARKAAPAETHANDYVCISVRDQGPGIPEESLSRLFEPFFTTKDPDQGTGLGLSVCKGLVEGNGGWIEVDSAAGRGAEFRVYLRPLPQSEPG